MRRNAAHVPAVLLLAAMSLLWTWPLARHMTDHITGLPGDNFSFVWNLWWMRQALSSPDLDFLRSTYLFSPFGVDLVNHPHTALQGVIAATVLGRLSVIEAENILIIASLFLNAVCAYALAFDIARERRAALLAAAAFGGSPYIAAHLFGHVDLLSAWVLPLFALLFRRALLGGRAVTAGAAGLCAAAAAYSAYYHVVYIGMFALAYAIAWWDCVRFHGERRADPATGFTLRLIVVALASIDLFVIVWIVLTGGTTISLGVFDVTARSLHNPLLALWLLAAVWMASRWRLRLRIVRPPADVFWRGTQALTTAGATFALGCFPLILQAFRLAVSGRYVSQVYYWRSAPRGIDALSVVMGNPFHPWLGGGVARLYDLLGLDRIEGVGWIGVVPMALLLMRRGQWHDAAEAKRWKTVLGVFFLFALGPFLTIAGFDVGLPLPQALARFVPIVENARMPGRAMVGVYLSIGALIAMRLASVKARAFVQWALVALLAADYLNAPIPLTALDRPLVYERLAAIDDSEAVIEVPFGIGDGLSAGVGAQDRRILYYATIHGHPLMGGYIGRMPPGVAQAYAAMPVVGNLLRLSAGEPPIEDGSEGGPLPFRYLVLDARAASQELVDYVTTTIDMDRIAEGDGRELYAVQGVRLPSVRVSR